MKDTPIKKEKARQEPQLFGRKEPQVSVGIVSGQKIVFTLNKPYTAKGAAITGLQEVEFSEGAILWHGQQYREKSDKQPGKLSIFWNTLMDKGKEVGEKVYDFINEE